MDGGMTVAEFTAQTNAAFDAMPVGVLVLGMLAIVIIWAWIESL
jgi:hypothetical protein